MTVIVTRDVAPRFRGFLASIMLEVAPGVYVSPNLSSEVRERIWTVLSSWFANLSGSGIAMIWKDPSATGGLGLRHLGNPPKAITDADGMLLVKRN